MDAEAKYRARLLGARSWIGRWRARRLVRALLRDHSVKMASWLATELPQIEDSPTRLFVREQFGLVKDQPRINAICGVWLESREPELARLILDHLWFPSYPTRLEAAVALATNREFRLNFVDPAVIEALMEFCSDPDSAIALSARHCLLNLKDPKAIDAFCGWWAVHRGQIADDLLASAKFVAETPLYVRVLTILKTSEGEALADGNGEVALALLRAAADIDAAIAARARGILGRLSLPEARETVCNEAIDSHNAIAKEVAAQAGYIPSGDVRRAVFFFLTEQWRRYDALDFDGRLLASAYEAGDRKLRGKIAEAARRAGRAEWAQLLAGLRQERRLSELTDEEWDAAVSVLAYNQRWGEMWRLAQSAPPDWALRLIEAVQSSGWSPSLAPDQASFQRIVQLASQCRVEPPFLGRLIRGPEVVETYSAPVTAIALSRHGNILASGSHNATVRLRTMGAPSESRVLAGHSDWVTCIKLSPNDRVLASGSNDRSVRLWDVATGAAIKELSGHADAVRAIAFTPDGHFLASASEDKTARLWRVPEGDPVAVLGGHHDVVSCLAISPNGEWLATGCYDSEIRLWRLPEGQFVGTFSGHRALITCLQFTPDSNCLISGSKDRSLLMWDVPTGTKRHRLRAHSDDVSCLAISADSQYLASGSWDSTARLWKLSTGELIETLGGTRTTEGHSAWISCLCFSPDERVLATGSFDQSIRLWGIPGGAPLKSLEDHSDRVSCLAFGPEGCLLVSGGWDGKVCVWKSELARLRRIPIGQIPPRDHDWLEKTLENSMLDGAERSWLEVILALSRWRTRYEIEVDQPRIAIGEFDIEIET